MTQPGNQCSVIDNFDIIKDTMNNAEKHSHMVPFHSWLCHFSPFVNHVLQEMVIKPDKDLYLVQ